MKRAFFLALLSILICSALPADDLVVGTDGDPVLIRGVANGGAIQIKANSNSFDRWLRLGQIDNSLNFYTYMHMSDNGNVGIGTTTPSMRLHVAGSGLFTNDVVANGNVIVGTDLNTSIIRGATNGGAIQFRSSAGTTDRFLRLGQVDNAGVFSAYMHMSDGGFVGIGTTAPAYRLDVHGDAHFTGTVYGGNIQATYQDVAEWVPASSDLEPGTVVVLNPEKTNEVMPSSSEYDTSVAGVVSPQPGIILGVQSASKEMIATTGRVRVRVDATAAPIRVGDLLVTSGKPGVAMRSEPIAVGGRRIHQPGTIIGKALEPLAGGTGEILVLLSLQ